MTLLYYTLALPCKTFVCTRLQFQSARRCSDRPPCPTGCHSNLIMPQSGAKNDEENESWTEGLMVGWGGVGALVGWFCLVTFFKGGPPDVIHTCQQSPAGIPHHLHPLPHPTSTASQCPKMTAPVIGPLSSLSDAGCNPPPPPRG